MRRVSFRYAGRVAVVVTLTVGLSGCWWSQFRFGPGRTAYNGAEVELDAGSVGEIGPLWSSPLTPGGLVDARGRLVFRTADSLYALSASTGQVAWQQPIDFLTTGTPVVRGGVVYTNHGASPQDCSVAALQAWDRTTGARRPADDVRAWEDAETCDGPSGNPAIGRRYAVLPGFGYCDVPDCVFDSTRIYDWQTGSNTLVSQIHLGGGRHETLDEAARRMFFADPSFGSYSIGAMAFDGSLLWRRTGLPASADPNDPFLVPLPVTDGSHVYSSQPNGVKVFDAATGADAWLASAPDLGTGTPYVAYPAVRNGEVFTARGGTLLAYEQCGTSSCPPVWTGPGDGAVRSVVAAGELVYLTTTGTTDSTVRIYAADGCGQSTCDPLATVSVDGLARETIVSGGRVFVSTSTGVHAFGLSS